METIYLILIFLAPGLIIKAIDTAERATDHTINKSSTIYEQLFQIVVHSIIVSIISIFFIWCVHSYQGVRFPVTISEFMGALDTINILMAYSIVMLVITVLFKLLLNKFIMPIWFKLYNKQMEKKYGAKRATINNATVWEDIFLNSENNKKPLVVSIYKDGQYITSGIIQSWNSGRDDPSEFEIVRSQEIKRILADDSDRKQKDKWLHYIDFEFLDCNSGILIQFYDVEKTLKHWEEFEL